jgi:hypothetical protein
VQVAEATGVAATAQGEIVADGHWITPLSVGKFPDNGVAMKVVDVIGTK